MWAKCRCSTTRPPFEQKALLDTGPITNHVNFANNRQRQVCLHHDRRIESGEGVPARSRRRNLWPAIPVGSLPHGLWPSGDGSRVYVALENGGMAAAIDTVSNKVIATIPIGQTTQALVYVPGAVASGSGTATLRLSARPQTPRGCTCRRRKRSARRPGVGRGKLARPPGSAPDCGGRTRARAQVSGVPRRLRSSAFREASASGNSEDESRWSRHRSGDRTAEGSERSNFFHRFRAALPDRYQGVKDSSSGSPQAIRDFKRSVGLCLMRRLRR